MTSLDLVAPAYRDAAAAIPAFDYRKQPVEEIRRGLAEAYEQALGSPDRVPKQEVAIARKGIGPLRALLYRPMAAGAVRGAILHMHGGGWVAGTPDMFAPFCAGIANRHRLVVLSVDYRLVPEAPGGAALEDGLTALGWLRAEAGRLGFDPDRIAVLGDSAGGNLAAGLALRARDENLPLKAQLLIYPALDDRTAGPDAVHDNPWAGEFVLTKTYLRQLWQARLEDADVEDLGYLAPARNETLEGLPPAFVAVGSLDVLVDEAVDYSAGLGRAGVSVELHVYAGVFHGFDLVPGPETDSLKADLARAIERFFA